jgi:methionyl-tRNA formyltransferase
MEARSGERYLLCAHRPWNIRRFGERRARLPGDWQLVTEPSGLTADRVAALQPARIFLIDWSWRVPPEITRAVECIGFHPTALPFGRGGSPYQNLILRRQYTSVLTAFRLVDEIDAGPIYLQRPIDLSGAAHEFFWRTSATAFDMLVEIITTNPSPRPQVGEPVVFTRRTPRDSELPVDDASLEQAYDFIRMLDAPTYPPASLDVGRLRLLFRDARLEGDAVEARVRIERRAPGDAR